MRSALLLGALLWGCGVAAPAPKPQAADPIPLPALGDQVLCESTSQCGEGERCVAGICESTWAEADAGGPDAAELGDADHPLDTSVPDATAADFGLTDAGATTDTGAVDLGSSPTDAGAPDLGRLDSGLADAGGSAPPFVLGGLSLVNLEQADDQRFLIPSGTTLGPGESLVLVRSADRQELEVVVGPLPSQVQVISTGASSIGAPIINGGESFQLEDSSGQVVDGPTPVGQAGEGYQRTGPGVSDFTVVVDPIPGHGPPLPASPTPRIVAWADRTGTGQFRFEWVEIRYDP